MFLALMDVRGRGEAALMSTSIAPRSMKGKSLLKNVIASAMWAVQMLMIGDSALSYS